MLLQSWINYGYSGTFRIIYISVPWSFINYGKKYKYTVVSPICRTFSKISGENFPLVHIIWRVVRWASAENGLVKDGLWFTFRPNPTNWLEMFPKNIIWQFISKTCYFFIFTFSSHTEYVKRESIVKAWVKKKFSPFDECSWFVCLRR